MEEDKHIKKVYCDKASKYLKICIGILIFNGLTYLLAILLDNSFDFGIIFETITFIFILLTLHSIARNNLYSAKRNNIVSMIPIGWLIIYDFIDLLINIDEVAIEVSNYYLSFDSYFYYLTPYLVDVTLIALIVLLYKTFSSLSIADGTKKSNDYTDTFYDKL